MHTLSIGPSKLCEAARDRRINLIDVRTPAEYAAVHAAGAVNIPLDELDAASVSHLDPAEPIYLICKSGARAAKAIHKLRAAGYCNLINVHGGTDAWVTAGLPHERGLGVIPATGSCEAQVP
jgi:rhodanese-related sulfurtransferase